MINEIINNQQQMTFTQYLTNGEVKLSERHYVIGVAEKMIEEFKNYGNGLAYRNGKFYFYDGTFWVELEETMLKQCIALFAEKIGVKFSTAKYFEFSEKVLKQFVIVAFIGLKENDNLLINLSNGTLEINPEGVILREFRMEDFLTYKLGFDYNKDALAPKFRDFLNSSLSDKEKQNVISEFLGSVFDQKLKHEKVLLCHGGGDNGKSVLFEIINALLGRENITNFSLTSITNRTGYSRAMLDNKLLNYAPEISGKLDSSFFKQMASGEPIEARLLYKDPFIMTRYARLAFNCNELPTDIERNHAFYRRFLIIHFDRQFSPSEQNPHLSKEIIEEELSGVFNWVLSGLQRIRESKFRFSTCKSCTDVLNKYKRESDSVLMFLDEEGYEKSMDDGLNLTHFYNRYTRYCEDANYRPVSRTKFGKRIRGDGYSVVRKGVGMFVYCEKAGGQDSDDSF